MEALAAIAALIGAGVVQWFNRYKSNNTALLKVLLVVIGLLAYGIGQGFPHGFGPPLVEWLNHAWPWALAVPGAASLVAAAPNMATNSK